MQVHVVFHVFFFYFTELYNILMIQQKVEKWFAVQHVYVQYVLNVDNTIFKCFTAYNNHLHIITSISTLALECPYNDPFFLE